jgi:hypothetical protein
MAEQTPNLESVLQEVISSASWKSGNPLVVIISRALIDSQATGGRWAESGEYSGAPMLRIVYDPMDFTEHCKSFLFQQCLEYPIVFLFVFPFFFSLKNTSWYYF